MAPAKDTCAGPLKVLECLPVVSSLMKINPREWFQVLEGLIGRGFYYIFLGTEIMKKGYICILHPSHFLLNPKQTTAFVIGCYMMLIGFASVCAGLCSCCNRTLPEAQEPFLG